MGLRIIANKKYLHNYIAKKQSQNQCALVVTTIIKTPTWHYHIITMHNTHTPTPTYTFTLNTHPTQLPRTHRSQTYTTHVQIHHQHTP